MTTLVVTTQVEVASQDWLAVGKLKSDLKNIQIDQILKIWDYNARNLQENVV